MERPRRRLSLGWDATKRRANARRFVQMSKYWVDSDRFDSDWTDVLGFWALASFADVELNGLTLFEVLEAVAPNIGEVDEEVIAAFLRDESKTLLSVEELNSAGCHNNFSFSLSSISASQLIGGYATETEIVEIKDDINDYLSESGLLSRPRGYR